jgi:uncharacterized membrane protein
MDARLKQNGPLFALIAWCVVLLGVRISYVGNTTYGFMAWNMILAVIPLGAASAFRSAGRRQGLLVIKIASFAVWLTFLPNAPYMVTDLVHLSHQPPVPLWFDVAFFGSFAATGVLIGYASVADVQAVFSAWYGRAVGYVVAIASLLLSGFGIYLGRVLHWNSWDVVASPATLAGEISDKMLNPISHSSAWAVSAIYGVGLVLGYLALRGIASALHDREIGTPPDVRVS